MIVVEKLLKGYIKYKFYKKIIRKQRKKSPKFIQKSVVTIKKFKQKLKCDKVFCF